MILSGVCILWMRQLFKEVRTHGGLPWAGRGGRALCTPPWGGVGFGDGPKNDYFPRALAWLAGTRAKTAPPPRGHPTPQGTPPRLPGSKTKPALDKSAGIRKTLRIQVMVLLNPEAVHPLPGGEGSRQQPFSNPQSPPVPVNNFFFLSGCPSGGWMAVGLFLCVQRLGQRIDSCKF